MGEKIDISKLLFPQRLIAKECDKDNNGFLEETKEFDEISLFNQKWEKQEKYITEKNTSIFTAKQDNIPDTRPETGDLELLNDLNNNTSTNITKEVNSVRNAAGLKKIKLSFDDTIYWAERIKSVAETYDIPPQLLASIIARESGFQKNVNSENGRGPMGVTGIACEDFFPDAEGSWSEIYKNMNEKLYNDILYEKDSDGNFKTDNNGNYILKFSSPKELRDACAKDDEFGMKVGLLCFQMNYVKAVAQKEHGQATFANVPKVINKLKDGQIKLNAKENKEVVTIALKNYNSVYNTYGKSVVDSLSRLGMEFKDLYFIPQNAK